MIGIIIVVSLYLPMLILGENALITMHDQLDGEVLVYVLRAVHPGESVIPELFNGTSATSLTPASVGTLVLYCIFPASVAFFVNYILIAILSYAGMYLCLDRMFRARWLAMSVAVIFSILPFYSVYGLSVMGQPLLLFALIELIISWKTKMDVLGFDCVFCVLFLSDFGWICGYSYFACGDRFFLDQKKSGENEIYSSDGGTGSGLYYTEFQNFISDVFRRRIFYLTQNRNDCFGRFCSRQFQRCFIWKGNIMLRLNMR